MALDPSLVELARQYNQDRKIRRVCYARLDNRAVSCRKKGCGHTNQLRSRRKLK